MNVAEVGKVKSKVNAEVGSETGKDGPDLSDTQALLKVSFLALFVV